MWSGAISFGLVNIPIKLYSASGESSLDLDMLAKRILRLYAMQKLIPLQVKRLILKRL